MSAFELGVCVPVLDEVDRLPTFVAAIDRALSACDRPVAVAIADNGSTDGSWELLRKAAAIRPHLRVVRTSAPGPGHARSAAARLLERHARGSAQRYWILSCDADNLIDADHLSAWACALDNAASAVLVTGAYVFDEDPIAAVPGGAALQAAWVEAVAWCEAIVGVVNPTGANHAVRLDALRSVGWYRQPVSHVVGSRSVVSGDDWDLGVRLRLAGAAICRVPLVVRTSARRAVADPTAYLTGKAHDGVFRRIEAAHSSVEQVALPAGVAVRARAVAHFLVKPVLLGLAVDWTSLGAGLPAPLVDTIADIHGAGRAAWDRSRDEFVYGLLPGLADLTLSIARALA